MMLACHLQAAPRVVISGGRPTIQLGPVPCHRETCGASSYSCVYRPAGAQPAAGSTACRGFADCRTPCGCAQVWRSPDSRTSCGVRSCCKCKDHPAAQLSCSTPADPCAGTATSSGTANAVAALPTAQPQLPARTLAISSSPPAASGRRFSQQVRRYSRQPRTCTAMRQPPSKSSSNSKRSASGLPLLSVFPGAVVGHHDSVADAVARAVCCYHHCRSLQCSRPWRALHQAATADTAQQSNSFPDEPSDAAAQQQGQHCSHSTSWPSVWRRAAKALLPLPQRRQPQHLAPSSAAATMGRQQTKHQPAAMLSHATLRTQIPSGTPVLLCMLSCWWL